MKKSIFAFALLLLFSSTAVFSQARIGVKGALNMASLKAEDNEEFIKSIFAPQAGLVVYSNLENPIFVQSGLLYNVKGAKGEDENIDVKLTYSFLELPLNIGFQLPVSSSVKVSPYVGGFVGYALTGKAKLGGITFDLFDTDFGDLEEEEYDPKRLDYGANVGVGLHFNDRVIISVQYSHGLANLADNDLKNQTRTLSAGLTFLF